MDDKLKDRVRLELRIKQLEDRRKREEERKAKLWANLKPFKTPDDIPDIPHAPKDMYEKFYVPRLIAAGAIPKKDMVDGQIYLGKHRRCTQARWNQKINKFEYWREKFGTRFIDTCNHFEDDDGFALFVPIRKIELAFD